MSGLSDTNIVLGQGDAIKEVHNIRRQDLELNQQFVAQKAEKKKKEERSKVQDSAGGDRVNIKGDEEEKGNEAPGENKRDPMKKKTNEVSDPSEKRLIDIKV